MKNAKAMASPSCLLDQSKSLLCSVPRLKQDPYCFIVDTDSVPYVIDTGADRTVINDAKLFNNLTPTSDKIKCISGKCVRIAGVSDLDLNLRLDN